MDWEVQGAAFNIEEGCVARTLSRMATLVAWLSISLALASPAAQAGAPHLVLDINKQNVTVSSSPQDFTDQGAWSFLDADDGNGSEPWLPSSALWPFYGVSVVFGTTRLFVDPASQALLPFLVPATRLPGAIGWNSSAWRAPPSRDRLWAAWPMDPGQRPPMAPVAPRSSWRHRA